MVQKIKYSKRKSWKQVSVFLLFFFTTFDTRIFFIRISMGLKGLPGGGGGGGMLVA